MRASLTWRIAWPFVCWSILVVTGVLIIMRISFEHQYLEQQKSHLLAEAQILGNHLESLRQTNQMAEIREELLAFARAANAWAAIYTPQGELEAEGWGAMWHLQRLKLARSVALPEGVLHSAEFSFVRDASERLMMVTLPLISQDNGQIYGILRVAILTTISDQILNQLTFHLILVGLAAVLLAGSMALLVSRLVVLPLRQLTESITQLSHNGTSLALIQSREDEIGHLARAFSDMAGELRSQIEALAAERVQFDAVLEYMTDGVIIVDAEGKVHLTNPAAERLFGTPPEGGEAKSLIEVVRHHQLVELWRKALSNNRQYTTTLEMTPNRLFVQAIATPLGGALKGNVLLVIQDLTRVRRLETVRRDFISNVSHELRTPLATLKALTETLQEGALEDPLMARRFLEQMDKEIDNMTQLVRELLELSRIESGKVPLNRQPVSPLSLLESAASRMRLQAERVGLTLDVHADSTLPMVLADRERIEQVLINLLHNAIKFTPPGGRIDLAAQMGESEVIFSVKDTGVGISSEALPRIFERFYKADQSRSGGGTGLGLSIARHTVEAHGGRIWAESEINRGSTFFFSLPVATQQ
ncbi:ATP-binding protein [uncultured Thermanaerothrix sp.]|uniref:sensor histidine kinase n=1 Tax=uncultured Thermanaerothrix sp. TaxID=1195149 RepID=UPI00261C0B3C|nr:ATP-binding protein [uncultured Thermanaerothrix sp.]